MIFLVAMLCISSTVFAQGNITEDGSRVNKGKLSKEEELIVEKRSEEVGKYFLAVAKARAKLNEITEQHMMNSNQFLSAKAELEELEKGYEKLGLIRVDKGDQSIAPLSTRGDYEIDKLTIYYDSKVNLHVIEMAGMWQNTNFYNDAQCPFSCSGTINVGGKDGIGLFSLHRDINVFSPKFYTITHGTLAETDWSYRTSDPKDSRGAGFYFQDTVQVARVNPPKFEKYNAYRHLMWYYFNFTDGYPPSGTMISFKASVGHTWASTSVNSISVGPWSVGISFSKDYDNWLREKSTYMSF
ncbi:hypothetical protein NDS46_28080 [Paenibacillus thiaminolyticus]|uniref:hypothetical protein n=1 Tax=Paenibacillus thiaminolyticus TaxID=49283 RepID=UPI00232AAB23|nr:hypothetical protein [Paenibacillus thiaminolyticus]WCF08073.1 hypothetical protein NDS46_28080 [Paenibacillus thiaminolyticus]